MSELPVLWIGVASRLRKLYANDDKPLPWAIIDSLEALAEAEDRPKAGCTASDGVDRKALGEIE